MGSVFRFKEFEVNQQDCAMKINTDGILLGAMVEAPEPLRVLDVGSGTGVIALMLAQRFPDTLVDAIDIDEIAFLRTRANFSQSKFADRMCALFGDFETVEPHLKYDLIVSNPPFYINTLHNPDHRKRVARHTDLSFFRRLITFSKERLTAKGTLQLILPIDLSQEIQVYTEIEGLTLVKEVNIQSFVDSSPIRKILIFGQEQKAAVDYRKFVIYKQKSVYSDDYQMLLKPFFLGF